MYILISKCRDNLNSNTTDFEIQGVDGNEKILICITSEQERPYRRQEALHSS